MLQGIELFGTRRQGEQLVPGFLADVATVVDSLPLGDGRCCHTIIESQPNDPEVAQQRSAVAFSHDLHMGLYECLDCHHKYEDGVNVLDEDDLVEDSPEVNCAACHDESASIDRQRAFHRQCMGCHIQVRKAGEASGPEMCGACHLPEA